MNALPGWSLAVAVMGLLLLAFGCVVPGGYGGTYLGYYEPSGFSYGGWGAAYDVGPWRAGGFPHGGEVIGHHAFRPAPAGRAMPSIPSHARAGGSARGEHR